MTDNEIIKAFKDFLIEQVDGYTDHIETGGERYEFIEKELELLKETDNLINRQKAEIKALRMDNQQLQSDIINANMNADHALAEIERLTAERDVMHQDVIAAEEYAWQCKTAKAEAYKEFAERLKERFDALEWKADTTRKTLPIDFVKEQMEWILKEVSVETIDNLLKEMVGDN